MKIIKKSMNPRKFGKKAFADDMIYWAPKLIYYGIVILVVMLVLITFIKLKFDFLNAEAEVYANRALYSLDSISYYDESLGRLYPGIIDPEKFNDKVIGKSMHFNYPEEQVNTYVAMKFRLEYDGKTIDAYCNKEWYERFLPRTSKTGRGGVYHLTEERSVLVRDADGSLKPGKLIVDVLVPNE